MHIHNIFLCLCLVPPAFSPLNYGFGCKSVFTSRPGDEAVAIPLDIYLVLSLLLPQSFKLPSSLQEGVDLGSITIRSKPFQDKEV